MRRSIAVILIAVAALVVAGVLIYAISNPVARCGGEGQPTCTEYCSANPNASECNGPTGKTTGEELNCGGVGEPPCPTPG